MHKVRRLPEVPCALRLIENDDVFIGRIGINEHIIAEMMYILNESLDAFANFSFPHLFAASFASSNFIACEGLAKNRYERAIAREKNRMSELVNLTATRGDI